MTVRDFPRRSRNVAKPAFSGTSKPWHLTRATIFVAENELGNVCFNTIDLPGKSLEEFVDGLLLGFGKGLFSSIHFRRSDVDELSPPEDNRFKLSFFFGRFDCPSSRRWSRRLLRGHASNVDFTDSHSRVLLERVLCTVATNTGDCKSDASKNRYPRWVSLTIALDRLP